jgi:hypothetical protein
LGSAAVLGAVDGGGKGSITVAMILSVITGNAYLGEKVWKGGPVAVVSYEDDEDEWERRLSSACLYYNLDLALIMPQVHFIYREDDRITFGTNSSEGVVFPDSDMVIEKLKEIRPVMTVVDPFNHAHGLDDGNNNTMIAKVAGEVTRIARVCNCAVLTLHHLRKGSTGSADDLMGATSLRATFRSCRVLARMSGEEARRLDISDEDKWRFIRVAGSKENYAPPPEKSTWFKLESVKLENPNEEYPAGDNIGVATMWAPPKMCDGMNDEQLRAVFEAYKVDDANYAPTRGNNVLPWAGVPLIKLAGRTDHRAAKIIKSWLDCGLLFRQEFKDEKSRPRTRVMLDVPKSQEVLESTKS